MSAALLALALLGPAHAADCTPEDAPLQVATLNTWGLPYPLSTQRRSRFSRIRRYVDSGFDLVGLQEVWTSARDLLGPLLKLPEASGDSGLALVTRLEASHPKLTPFTTARGVDALKRKGVIHSRMVISEGSVVDVLVTHLQAGDSDRAAAVRATQIDQLLALTDGLGGPTLLMGDFNLYADRVADQASLDRLRQRGFLDAARDQGALDPTYVGGTQRLDRIYVRGATPVSATVPMPGLSDHRPVEASVLLCRPPEGADR